MCSKSPPHSLPKRLCANSSFQGRVDDLMSCCWHEDLFTSNLACHVAKCRCNSVPKALESGHGLPSMTVLNVAVVMDIDVQVHEIDAGICGIFLAGRLIHHVKNMSHT